MRLTIAALIGSSLAAEDGVTPSSGDGFVGETCNIDNPGTGCNGTYRCAYVGLGFIEGAQEKNSLEKLKA
jgi:hypothetical protein